MKIFNKAKDKLKRHQERHSELGFKTIISDSINFVNTKDWDSIAINNTVFLSREYLVAIEENSPENTEQRYAMAYSKGVPVVIVSCQIAQITGENLVKKNDDNRVKVAIAGSYQERVLVCGNLVSSGLHGVEFSDAIDAETAWKVVAEILYKIRQAEKLSGKIDFVMVKDIKGEKLKASTALERFSYRKIQTDPDMVLDFGDENEIATFDEYLNVLTSKYRSRIRKIIKKIDQAGLECELITIDEETDKKLHKLYLEVENKSATRLATLPVGYFLALQNALGECFSCYAIKQADEILGFVTTIKDGSDAMAYYVGINYQANAKYPIYFRLLQLVIQSAIQMQCKRVLFGRTALEPKACLGAKPVDTYVWARHRVPLVNFIVRKLFRNIPFEEAPERSVIKN